MEKAAGGWTISGILTLHTGYGWTPVYQAPHQIYCNSCNYGFQNLRPNYLGGSPRDTSNDAFKTGSNFPPNPGGSADTGANNDQFRNNYFEVPNYDNAIADNPGQFASAFDPSAGNRFRNLLSRPWISRCRSQSLQGLWPVGRIPVLGEKAKIEVKANF